MKVVFDIENSTTKRPDDTTDFTPYNSANYLVSLGWGFVDDSGYTAGGYRFFRHNLIAPKDIPQDAFAEFQAVLDKTTLLSAHNAK